MSTLPEQRLPAARSTDAMLGVHVLTEFIFCPRAGLLTWERRNDDDGEDAERPPRLDYVPDYFLREITEELQAVTQRVWKFATWVPVGIVILSVIGSTISWLLAAMLLASCSVLMRRFWIDVRNMSLLSFRRSLAENATGAEPRLDIDAPQEVDWWELQKAGYEPIRLASALCDRRVRLAGKPWAVLQKNGVRIPVFLRHSSDRRLFPQHFARMAAYCHLVTACEHARSPFGVVLFSDSYSGIAIPMNDRAWGALEQGLNTARRVISARGTGRTDPGKPDGSSTCKDCPLGRPVDYQPGVTDLVVGDVKLEGYVTNDINGRPCVSECGTRFRWVPPHRVAIARRLTD